ncbi:MAG: 2'-5' RNA ligase family protein [Bacteroidia bacterium]|nr:2'-5' RNA ligase family protein [Bacteroidia bacterium]
MVNSPGTHSMYYVAIVCPPQVDEKVLHFKNWMKERFGCIVALKSPAHITLVPPFWMDEARETELRQTLRSFKSDIDELEISSDGFSHFGNKVLFINIIKNTALQELKNHTENQFIQLFSDVIRKDERPFHPHITIANRDMKPGDFEIAWKHFSNINFKETFLANSISLLRLRNAEINWQVVLHNA